MRSSHRSLEILLVHIMSYPTRCFAQYDCPQIPNNPQIIPHYISRQRSRRFFSGLRAVVAGEALPYFQERGGVCGDCGGTLSLDAAHHVRPRSEGETCSPGRGGTGGASSRLSRTKMVDHHF